MQFPTLKRLLSTLFSIDVGLSHRSASEMYLRQLANIDFREQIRRELLAAIDDPKTDWVHLLMNDSYEVFEPLGQDDAMRYVIENLWTPLTTHFPQN
jgi:hypothetical protein